MRLTTSMRRVLLLISVAACQMDKPVQPPAATGALLSVSGPSAPTLKNSRPLLWSGTVQHTASPGGQVPECAAVPCHELNLTIALPGGVWHNKPGGVQVALRWFVFGNNLKLFVYRGGTKIATSDGIIATAQSVLIPTPANGDYKIYIAYDFDLPALLGVPLVDIPYEALAEVEYLPKVQPLRPLLPDLASRPQRNVTFDVPPPIFFEAGTPTTSCFPSEQQEEGAQLCLRFDQVLANVGEGALEIEFPLPADPSVTPTGSLIQRIYRSDGSVTERPGGTWMYHQIHDHYHYTGFALSRLWAIDANGGHGAAPARSHKHWMSSGNGPIRTGRKVSFCIVDIEIDAWAKKGDAARTYSFPTCITPSAAGALVQGMSAGWSDVYDWFLPDQYIEVSGLPDGLYLLETLVDPDDTILEADESNNCGAVFVRLSQMATATPRATLLGTAKACVRQK
ncbi:MAG: lysyl oxidase family protein [Gemmatimonadaceae bacterium]